MQSNLQSCCCSLDWCKAARKEHPLRNNMVRFNTNTTKNPEMQPWCDLLRIEPQLLPRSPRVWCGHFHRCDLMLKVVDGSLSYDGLVSGPTAYKYNISNSAHGAPPRPGASKTEVMQAKVEMSGELTTFSTASIAQKKRNASSMSTTTPAITSSVSPSMVSASTSENIDNAIGGNIVTNSVPTPTAHPNFATNGASTTKKKSGPKLGSKKPLHQSFVGTADCLIQIVRDTELHAKHCSGRLHFVRDKIKMKGLALERRHLQQQSKTRRHARAVRAITAAAADAVQVSLGLGAVQRQRTTVTDGVTHGRQTADPMESARLLAPFPFAAERLLNTEEDLQRIEKIWEHTITLHSRMDDSPVLAPDQATEGNEASEMDVDL